MAASDVGRKRQFSLSLEPAYSGLLRDVYKDERSGVVTQSGTLRRPEPQSGSSCIPTQSVGTMKLSTKSAKK